MTKALNSLIVALGAWLVISPFLLEYGMPSLLVTSAIGVAVIVIALISMKGDKCSTALEYVLVALGVCLAVWGLLAAVFGFGNAWGNDIVLGALIALVAFGATRFAFSYEVASFYDRGGAPMVDVKGLRLKDDEILMKALLLQSMPSTVYVRPDEVWKVLTMIPFDLIKKMPGFLVRGYKMCKQQEKESNKQAQ